MTRLVDLVAASTAIQTAHSNAVAAHDHTAAAELRGIGVSIARQISALIRNSRETQGEGVGK